MQESLKTLIARTLLGAAGLVLVASVMMAFMPGPARPATLAALGRRLFFDPRLSADGRTSCASCHQPAHAYGDDRAVSHGAFGRIGTRNVPSLLTLTAGQPLFWDGRRRRLEDAVGDPFQHPFELALADDHALDARWRSPAYHDAVSEAFGAGPGAAPARQGIVLALAAFVRSLPRPVTAFDRYQMDHADGAFSRSAEQGLGLFAGKAGCSSCHRLDGSPARLSDHDFHATGTGLQRIGEQLPRLSAQVAGQPIDATRVGREVAARSDLAAMGRFMVTHRPSDLGLFRTPSLRYVADTAPYMHDGSVPTLEAAVDQEIYWRGLSSGHPLSLTVAERADLLAFLHALSPVEAAPKQTP